VCQGGSAKGFKVHATEGNSCTVAFECGGGFGDEKKKAGQLLARLWLGVYEASYKNTEKKGV